MTLEQDPRHGPAFRSVFLVALGLTALAAGSFLASSAAGPGHALRGLPLDDAWIHLVYARSIAEGQPFQYNPGEWETGSTSPLWALLLAVPLLLGAGPVVAAKALGVLFTASAATAGHALLRRLGAPGSGLALAVTLCVVPYFTFASVSGTEVALFVALVLLAFERFLTGRLTAAGVATGLAILARPEAYLLLPLLVLACLADPRPAGAGQARALSARLLDALRVAGIAAATAAPWVLYCLAASGRPFPATFYAKATPHSPFSTEQWGKVVAFLAVQPFSGSALPTVAAVAAGALLGAPLWLAGLMRLRRAGWSAFVLVGLSGPLFLAGLVVTLPLGWIGRADEPGSLLNFYNARYLLPALAPLLATQLLGLAEFAERSRAWTGVAAAPVVVGVALLALPLVSAVYGHAQLRAVYSWNCQNIEAMQVAAGRWIDRNLPAGARVAASDAGAVRWFGRRAVVDLNGLNAHRLLPRIRALYAAPEGSAEERDLLRRLIAETRVDHAAILAGRHPWLRDAQVVPPLVLFDLAHNTICGSDRLGVLALRPPR